MLDFKDLVSRADSAWLQEHIGRDALKVLQALDQTNERGSVIRSVFRSLTDPYELLLANDARSDLFELLRPLEASDLAMAIGLPGDPYEALAKSKITRGSQAFKLCCSYFGLPEEPKEAHVLTPAVSSVGPHYGLFPHQQRAVLTTCDALETGRRRVVLHMPTGAGKTRMAMHILCRHILKYESTVVVWLANSEELCEQASEEFTEAWKYLGDRSIGLFRFWGSRDVALGDIRDGLVVAGFPKMYALAKSDPTKIAALGDRTTLLLVDEAHQSIAPTYELIIQGLAARNLRMRVLGLTATPGRTWNEPEADRKLAEFFAHTKVSLDVPGFSDPVDFLVRQGFLADPSFRQIEYLPTNLSTFELQQLERDLDVPAAVLKKLAADEVRTVKIIREIERLCEVHHRVIVFATTVAHAKLITAVLSAREIAAKCVTANTDEAARVANIGWYKDQSIENRVIVNFGVLTTGFDAPKTSAALIARPTKSLVLYSQMVGRAIRGPLAGGNPTAEIVTVVDTSLPGFGNLAAAFTNWEDVW
jgi:DNA repair protein RadD